MTAAGTFIKEHPILAGALGCALVATAHAEYTLATATHVNQWVALAVPGALDLYVIQALRVRRDVAAAVLVMVAANVASHLLVAGVLPVHWAVIAAVGAVAPGIVWRVHSLEYTRTRKELRAGVDAGAVSAPAEYPDEIQVRRTQRVHADGCDALHPERVLCQDHVPALASAPDHVPAEWAEVVNRSAAVLGLDPDEPYPLLRAVPDLPAPLKDRLTDDEWDALSGADRAYLPKLQTYLEECAAGDRTPSVRGLKEYANIGQARAQRLIKHATREGL